MKKKIAAVIAATVLTLTGVVTIAPATTASAVSIQYKCQRYDWFFGWRTRYTTNYSEVQHLMANGWTCYCILSYP